MGILWLKKWTKATQPYCDAAAARTQVFLTLTPRVLPPFPLLFHCAMNLQYMHNYYDKLQESKKLSE